jgi:hypothetical protein
VYVEGGRERGRIEGVYVEGGGKERRRGEEEEKRAGSRETLSA